MSETNRFIELSSINVNEKTEQKNKLTYLSWPFAWAEVKKRCPDATYNIKRFEHNLPYVFDEKVGYMVFTDVTIDGLTHEMWLPVMDGANAAMKDKPYQYQVMQWQNGKKVSVTKDCAAADMFDINKTIMRCLVKNLAMFGLGLYIYAGEDLPDDGEEKPVPASKLAETQKDTPAQVTVSDRPLTWQEQTEIICNVNRIKMDLFKDLFAALKQDGKFVNKTVDKLTTDEWQTLKPLIAAAVNATKPK
jgi:hypothetical protein